MKTTLLGTALLTLALAIAAPVSSAAQSQKPSYKAPVLNDKYLSALGYAGQQFSEKKAGVWTLGNGLTIYSSHPWGDEIRGYAGATPLFIAVDKKGVIRAVAPAVNTESPMFWKKVKESKLFSSWNGVKLQKAATKKVDTVSGATLSSTAVIRTVQATAKGVGK